MKTIVLSAMLLMAGLTAQAQSTKQETVKTSAGKQISYSYTLSEAGNNTTVNVTIPAEEAQKMAKHESTGITLPAIPGLAYDFTTLKSTTGIMESPVAGFLLLTGNGAASFSIGTKQEPALANKSVTLPVTKN